MSPRVSRRDALKQLGAVGAGTILVRTIGVGAQGETLTIGGQPIEIAVSSVNPDTVRLTIRRVSGGSDASLADGALVKDAWGSPAAAGLGTPIVVGRTSVDVSTELRADPGSIRIEVAGSAFRSGSDMARLAVGTVGQRFELDRTTGRVTFSLAPNVPLIGLGEGGPQFDRRGNLLPYRSGQGAYRLQTHGGRVPVQWLIQPGRSAFYIHQPLGAFDLTGPEGHFDPPASGPLPLDIFVVASADPAEIMKAWSDITGDAEMPPLWSLGYLQSHRTLGGAAEVQSVARTFREKKLPCDGLIYLGTDFCPSGWNTHNGEFTWKAENFPDPKAAIDELHAQHFKVVLHIVIEGRTLKGTVSDPCTAPALPPGRTPDNQWPPDRQVSCYWPAHKPLFDLGIDGWWPDQGDGFDGPSRLARNRMYWDGSQMYRPGQRVFALHRNGYAGMQRIAAFLWSGDVYSFWETLKQHVPNAVNTALSGIPYWGTDIGGFVPTADYTGELHVRWFQFGTFNPLFRAHGRTWHLRLPWGWNTGELGFSEVATYTGGAQNPPESELHNAAVEPIIKKYLELRYRLLPYTYTAVRDCRDTGMPILRAMWLHHPDDPAAVARGDQYLWGRDILVAPVVEKGATVRKVYLPKGTWHDFWTEQSVVGGREVDRAVDLATMPLYVRAGAVVPMGPVRQYVDEPVSEPIVLVVYPGADATSSLYEDDGKTFGYRGTEWMKIDLRWRDATRTLTLQPAAGSGRFGPATRTFNVRLAGSQRTTAVQYAGRSIDVKV